MKGIIVNCLKALVYDKFGVDKWQKILSMSNLDPYMVIHATKDIDDNIVLKVVDSTCKVLNISMEQATDAFGEYWVNVYAPKIYEMYYKGVESAKDFLLKMDDVHKNVTKNLENAKPPSFKFEWKDDKTLIVKYISHRGLIDFYVGLARGVGIYFKEDIKVKKLKDEKVEIIFP